MRSRSTPSYGRGFGIHRQRVLQRLKLPWYHARLVVWDAIENRKYARAERRFLVVRHPRMAPHFYDLLLHWLTVYFPDLRRLFELHPLAYRVRDWSRYALHIPWLQDPVQAWSPSSYRRANRLAEGCDAHRVPIINRVDRLTNAAKSTGARLIADATGFRTPTMVPIDDPEAFRRTRLGLSLPVIVREDWGHGGPMLRADSDAEVRALPIERLRRPIAAELIDVRDPADGVYRKYRYVVAGETGVPQTLHVSTEWAARGARTHTVFSAAIRDEEIAYTERPEPRHAQFVAAREALGLDFVAFDYSFDRDGRVVVWEANPYPYLHILRGRRRYRVAPTTRVLAAMTKLYLTRAGMEVPQDLDDELRPRGR